MQFTLCLSDYIDQYTANVSAGDKHCPVCYQQVMCDDDLADMTHLLRCYKDHRVTLKVRQFYRVHGTSSTVPMDTLEQMARDERVRCAQEINRLMKQRFGLDQDQP